MLSALNTNFNSHWGSQSNVSWQILWKLAEPYGWHGCL